MTAMHGLKEGEQGYLLSHTRLVSHVTEKNCERLILFQDFARIDLEMCQKIDSMATRQSGGPPSQGFVGDREGRVLNIAKAIRTHDRTLSGMLLPEGILGEEETNRICRMYALLVIGHENESNCKQILKELRELRDQILSESPHAKVPSIPEDGTCS